MISFCLGLYLVGTVASQSLLDAGIILLLLCWIYQVVQDKGLSKNARLNLLGLDYFVWGYFIVICLGYIFPASPDTPVHEYIYKLTWMGHIYLLVWSLQRIEINLEKMLLYFGCAFLLPTVYSLASYINGEDLITGRINERITGLVNSSTYHAHGNAMILVFFAALYVFNFEKLQSKNKIFVGACLGLLALSIFLTFTRGIWLALLISSVIMLWNYRRKWSFYLVSAVVLGSGLAFLIWDKFRERIVNSLHSGQIDHERWSLLRANWEMFLSHPLFGIGYADNMRQVQEYWTRWGMPKDYLVSHAHNQLVNVLSTTGILGFICFCGFYFGFLFFNIQLLRSEKIKAHKIKYALSFACLWVQVEFILANFTDVGFEYAKIRAIILMAWALVVVLRKDLFKQLIKAV